MNFFSEQTLLDTYITFVIALIVILWVFFQLLNGLQNLGSQGKVIKITLKLKKVIVFSIKMDLPIG